MIGTSSAFREQIKKFLTISLLKHAWLEPVGEFLTSSTDQNSRKKNYYGVDDVAIPFTIPENIGFNQFHLNFCFDFMWLYFPFKKYS